MEDQPLEGLQLHHVGMGGQHTAGAQQPTGMWLWQAQAGVEAPSSGVWLWQAQAGAEAPSSGVWLYQAPELAEDPPAVAR